ncbi:MAG: helix-turn-helix transcriptional regulator [Proteobacteria bacterium]|nr:helix-turn-helix transcriptional regulator [Pseudomonadota bacterium]
MSTLAENVRALRLAKGLSQPQLARAVGVSRAAISTIEAGRRKSLRGETLIGLASVLGVEPSRIFDDSAVCSKLSGEELALLRAFNALPRNRQPTAVSLLIALAK